MAGTDKPKMEPKDIATLDNLIACVELAATIARGQVEYAEAEVHDLHLRFKRLDIGCMDRTLEQGHEMIRRLV